MKSKINIKPEVKNLLLQEIKPAPYNPRDISNEALAGLRMSLEQFGYVDLIVVNKRNMRIVAGHQRYKILVATEVKQHVPCVMVDVDEVQEQAMNISLNNQQIMGFWTEALTPILEKLRRETPDEYLSLRLDELREEVKDLEVENMGAGKTLPDDIPAPPKKTISRPGDMWILGDHKLLCGDSTDEADVKKLFGKEQAKLFATDPPYFVNYTGKNRPGKTGKDWSGCGVDEVPVEKAVEFLIDFYSLGLNFSAKNIPIYCWHAYNRSPLLLESWKKLSLLAHQQIIWVKPNLVLGYSIYPWRHEPCLFGWVKGNKPPYNSSRKIGTVWPVDYLKTGDPAKPEYYTDVWELDWDGKRQHNDIDHPTPKPTEVFAIPMRIHTRPGDVCYEPFCGSGSQIIAAERLNRRCFALEKMPVFVDVSVKRWEEFTGKKAKRIKNNKK